MTTLLLVTLFLCALTAATRAADEAGTSKLTIPAQGLPLDLWDAPLGTAQSLTFDLPADLSAYTQAILLLHVDDIDWPPETGLFVNDTGPLDWPESIIGEREHCGAIHLKMSDLRPGINQFRFVFEDNLNWNTTGFSILGAELQLFTQCSPERLARIIEDAATWGMPAGWTPQQVSPGVVSQYAASREPLGWKNHYIRQGDGHGGWIAKCAQYQMLQHPEAEPCAGFGLAQMDNGEVVLLGTCPFAGTGERVIIAFSSDAGCTWSELEWLPVAGTRPIMLASLGGGNLTFVSGKRYYSSDYGRTWSPGIPVQRPSNGSFWGQEGNPLVERDAHGAVTRMAEIGYNDDLQSDQKELLPSIAFVRWSYDEGRTWTDEVQPATWRWQETYKGKSYTRATSEGSLVRARNGWLVAALRTDRGPRYFVEGPHDDSLSGTAVSISKDDGQTWSPLNVLYEAGRHHAHLLLLPNGDILMTLTVRADIRGGKWLASYRRGCDAIVSHDNGLTWDLAHRYILDEYEYYDGKKWFNGACGHIYSVLLDDGSILTTHNNYLTKGISLIRWRP